MAPLVISDEIRAKAEIYTGDAAGQEKTRLLLAETELPSGLLPLKDIIECGYVEETGFVWLKQKKKVDHYFAKAGRHVSYAADVSAVAEKGRLKKITGVKAKEMFMWVNLYEICVDEPPTGKIHCKAIGGISRSFPVEAFEAEDGGKVVATGRLMKKQSAVEGEDKKEEEEEKAAESTVEEEENAAESAVEEEDKKEAAAAAAAVPESVEVKQQPPAPEKMKEMNAAVLHA